MAVNNSKAAFEALIGKSSEFRRTPKFAVTTKGDNWRTRGYVASKEITAIVEIVLGFLFFVQSVFAVYMGYYGWIPFLLLIQIGFFYTGFLSIIHGSGKRGSASAVNSVMPEPAFERDKKF